MANDMQVPSGRIFYALDRLIMQGAAEFGFVKWYDEVRTLASGLKSHIYVEGRQDTTENPRFLTLACRKILEDTRDIMNEEGDYRRPRFIGIPHVAHGWTPAISMVDHYENITNRKACHAVMRSELKEHGGRKGKWVAGASNDMFRDILFDNVVTDSGSKKIAATRLTEDGWNIQDVIAMVFVDREQGGFQEMKRMSFYHVHACYRLLDMTSAFQQMGLWPSDAVEKVQQEILENQVNI